MSEDSGNLNKLLDWDGDLDTQLDLKFDRDGFTLGVKIQSMSSTLNRQIEAKCTDIINKRGRISREVDDRKYLLMQIYECVVDPNLKDQQLQAKFNADRLGSPYTIVENIFKMGEQIKIAVAIQKLSGFDDIDEVESEISNLLLKE